MRVERVAQKNCGCCIPGSTQGQAGWGSEQSGIVGGVPAGGCNQTVFKVLQQKPFHDSVYSLTSFESNLASNRALRIRLTIHLSASSGVMFSLSANILKHNQRIKCQNRISLMLVNIMRDYRIQVKPIQNMAQSRIQ